MDHSTGRTRPWPLPTVLHAIAHTAVRPGAHLPVPRHLYFPVPVGPAAETIEDRWPLALMDLATGRLAGVAAWAQALTDVRITVLTDTHTAVVTVIGATSAAGPVVGVYDTVRDWPLDAQLGEQRITVEELAAVAKAALIPADELADMLAGAR